MMSEEEKKVYKLTKLVDNIAELEQDLARARAELKELSGNVEDMVQAAAERHLVDEQGQPVDGGVYWFGNQAIVRVGTIVRMIPMKTMKGQEVFAAPSIELPAEVEAEEVVEAAF